VLDFMTARYGDFVLYRPPLKATTVLLWAGPFLLLALGIVLLVRSVRRRPDPPALDEDERAAASRMLDGP
jgi:cytochrome c-type biogenesis protein CcmH